MAHEEKKLILWVLLLVLVGVSALSVVRVKRLHEESEAAAQEDASRASDRTPCDGDARTLCPGLSGAMLEACFNQHSLSISAPCIGYREEANPLNQWEIACAAETARFCSSTTMSERTVCLDQHRNDLSVACGNLVQRQMNIRHWHEICPAATETLCG